MYFIKKPIFVGWGALLKDHSIPTQDLKEIQLTMVETVACNKSYEGTLVEGQICAPKNNDTRIFSNCNDYLHENSGGPLVIDNADGD